MDVCPTCDRPIPSSAAVCEHCGVSAAKPLFAGLTPEAPVSETVGLGPREVMMIAVAVIGSGALTLAALSARGTVTGSAVVPQEVAPAPGRSSAAAGSSTSIPGWTENRAQWTGNSRRSLALELPARNETAVWMKKVRPILVVRCLANRTDVFVFTDSAAAMEPQDQDHTVRVAFDDEPERTERWPDSTAHDALFAPDGIAVKKHLMRSRVMRFGYTPHNAAPVVAHFDVSGLSERLGPGAAHCGSGK